MVGHISLIQLDPKPEPFRQPFPLLHVLPHALLTAVNKRLDSKLLDFILRVNAHRFADFGFDRQPVRVPTRLSLTVIPLHRFVTRKQVFDRAGQAMTGVGHAVGCWRPLEKDVAGSVGTLSQRLVVNVLVTPKLKDLFLEFGKADVTVDRLKHLKALGKN